MADVKIPEKLGILLQPKRYKVLYGGRGGGKSWSVALVLLLKGTEKPLRILCAREFQNSIRDSVHQLLSDKILEHGLDTFYKITNTSIEGANGTTFGFEGLKHNITKIKSYEGADIAWIEEAQTVSKSSWDVLIPTIRKEGSEIWLTFNPELQEDETYQRFVVRPPKDSYVVKVNYSDNPWFSKVLEQERQECLLRDPKGYQTIWEGECRYALEGAIYENELREANDSGRITDVPYDPKHPVSTFWDLGWGNHTSIWFVQRSMAGFRIIDCYENSMQKAQHYIQTLKERGYVYDRIYLPHDSEHEHVEAERTLRQIVESAFPGLDVRVLDNFSGAVKVGIEAARNIFPLCVFDKVKCADGLQALRHYHYKTDPDTGKVSREPEHDWSSDFADSWRYVAMAMEEPMVQRKKRLLHPFPSLQHDGFDS